MSGASADDLPFAVARPLQRWFDQLKIPNTTLFRAEAIANYELRLFHHSLFSDRPLPSTSLRTAIDETTWPLLRVTVPSKALGILPHFAIVAHEIGHALYASVQWDDSILYKQEEIVKAEVAKRLGVSPLNDDSVRRIGEITKNWLEEFSADAFGLLLAGPAFFFSMADFLQLEGGGLVLSKSHPPHDLRRGMLYDQLTLGNPSFASVFEEETGEKLLEDFNSPLIVRLPEKEHIFSALSGYDKEVAALLAELPDAFRNLQSHIYKKVHHCLSQIDVSAIYRVDNYQSDLRNHLGALLAAIPPIEDGTGLGDRSPTNFSAILNVGWAVVLTKLKDLRVKTGGDPEGAEKLERLHALLLKAVELAEARRDWENARGVDVGS
jgi:hypothetical protein